VGLGVVPWQVVLNIGKRPIFAPQIGTILSFSAPENAILKRLVASKEISNQEN
jgi:hypothetical protein